MDEQGNIETESDDSEFAMTGKIISVEMSSDMFIIFSLYDEGSEAIEHFIAPSIPFKPNILSAFSAGKRIDVIYKNLLMPLVQKETDKHISYELIKIE